MTNYEKIKSMSIEEMERECERHSTYASCDGCRLCKQTKRYSWDVCELQIKERLESEADDE